MRTLTDNQLLEAWAASGSDPAFAELVRRYLDLVYSAALRQVGDPPLAEDVVQAVFLLLARKAASLRHIATLAGWLYRSTRFTASRAIRAEARRRRHEQEAATMNPTAHLSDSENSTWAQVAPLLDEAMATLAEADRNAVLLRFFQGKPIGVVGEHLGVTEDAAKKRVSRAVDKLHVLLRHRGATLSAAGLGTVLATEAVTAAPAGLAASVSASVVASVAAGSATTLGVLKSMILAKLTLGITGVVLVSVLATYFFRGHRAQLGLREESQLSVTGSFTVDVAHAAPNHSHIDGTFSVSCKDGQWIIRSKRSDQPTDYEEDGHDGRYVYSLTSMETWAKNRREAGQQVGANTMEGEVTPGRFPFNSPEINRVLWLLYASGSYLSEMHLIKRLPPIASFSGRHAYLYGFQQPATWRVTGTSPPLPTFAVI
jgi:RNA polymerase sigma factor (sigma-70 family)